MHYLASNTNRARIIYIGLDVDDQAFHGCAIAENETEGIEFKTKPSLMDLVETLEKFKAPGSDIKICYEAGYLGYSLQRDLRRKDISVTSSRQVSFRMRREKKSKRTGWTPKNLLSTTKKGF